MLKTHIFGEFQMLVVSWMIQTHSQETNLDRNTKPPVWTMLPSDDIPLLAWYTPRDGFRMAGQGKSVTTRVSVKTV